MGLSRVAASTSSGGGIMTRKLDNISPNRSCPPPNLHPPPAEITTPLLFLTIPARGGPGPTIRQVAFCSHCMRTIEDNLNHTIRSLTLTTETA